MLTALEKDEVETSKVLNFVFVLRPTMAKAREVRNNQCTVPLQRRFQCYKHGILSAQSILLLFDFTSSY